MAHHPVLRARAGMARWLAEAAALRFACVLLVGPVMAGLEDDKAAGAAGRGCLPASYDQREQAIAALKAAFIQGLLDKDEFDLRLGQAFASRTYAELVAVTADLPAGPSAAQSPTPGPAPRVGPLVMALGAVVAGSWAFVFVAPDKYVDNKGVVLLVGIFTFAYVGILILAGIVKLESRHKERPRGQLPPRPAPGAGDQAFPRLPSDHPGGQLPSACHGHQHTAEAARRRFPRPPLPVRGRCAGSALGA